MMQELLKDNTAWYEPAVPHLDIYPEETKAYVQTKICA